MKKISFMKSKKFVIHAKKDLLLVITMELHSIKNIEKLEIIVTILENIEQLLIIFVI